MTKLEAIEDQLLDVVVDDIIVPECIVPEGISYDELINWLYSRRDAKEAIDTQDHEYNQKLVSRP